MAHKGTIHQKVASKLRTKFRSHSRFNFLLKDRHVLSIFLFSWVLQLSRVGDAQGGSKSVGITCEINPKHCFGFSCYILYVCTLKITPWTWKNDNKNNNSNNNNIHFSSRRKIADFIYGDNKLSCPELKVFCWNAYFLMTKPTSTFSICIRFNFECFPKYL